MLFLLDDTTNRGSEATSNTSGALPKYGGDSFNNSGVDPEVPITDDEPEIIN